MSEMVRKIKEVTPLAQGFQKGKNLRVLIVSNEWPSFDGDISGIHVVNQVKCLREAQINVEVFHFHGRRNLYNYLSAIVNFRRLDLNNYDIVHAHHGQSGIIAICQNSCPVVVTYHGSDLQGIRSEHGRWTLQGYLLRATSWLVAQFASEIIVVSDHLARYIPGRPYKVIPAGIDTDLFSPIAQILARQKLELPLEEKLVLFVGNPERPEKRYYLAKLVVEIVASYFPVKLILANGIPNEKMPLYMNACDVLLVTSSNEGSPNAVKEALACNLAVVSTNVGDVGQRIASIDGCALCLDDHPNIIAGELRNVLKKACRVNGREAVLHLNERLLSSEVISVYQKIFSKKN